VGVVVAVCWLPSCVYCCFVSLCQLCYCVSAASMLCVWNKCQIKQRKIFFTSTPIPEFTVGVGVGVNKLYGERIYLRIRTVSTHTKHNRSDITHTRTLHTITHTHTHTQTHTSFNILFVFIKKSTVNICVCVYTT